MTIWDVFHVLVTKASSVDRGGHRGYVLSHGHALSLFRAGSERLGIGWGAFLTHSSDLENHEL